MLAVMHDASLINVLFSPFFIEILSANSLPHDMSYVCMYMYDKVYIYVCLSSTFHEIVFTVSEDRTARISTVITGPFYMPVNETCR